MKASQLEFLISERQLSTVGGIGVFPRRGKVGWSRTEVELTVSIGSTVPNTSEIQSKQSDVCALRV